MMEIQAETASHLYTLGRVVQYPTASHGQKKGLDLGLNFKSLKATFLVICPCKDVAIHLLDFQKSY